MLVCESGVSCGCALRILMRELHLVSQGRLAELGFRFFDVHLGPLAGGCTILAGYRFLLVIHCYLTMS